MAEVKSEEVLKEEEDRDEHEFKEGKDSDVQDSTYSTIENVVRSSIKAHLENRSFKVGPIQSPL